MTGGVPLHELVRRSVAEHQHLEVALLGTADPDVVAAAVDRWCRAHLGAPVRSALRYRSGTGLVAVVRLADRRDVVVKVHRWQASEERLAAVHGVQLALADAGLPAPRPLALAPFVDAADAADVAIATAEEHRPGAAGDARRPATRRGMAALLVELVAAAPALPVGPAQMLRPEGAELWPEPHDLRFDLSLPGGEWIDDLATTARARLSTGLPHVVGHFDWRVENLGFRGDDVVAIWDWDSLATAPEAAVVGANAAQYTADWTRATPLPDVDAMRAFVADVEEARGGTFTEEERDVLDAANLSLCAYGARCEHSDNLTGAIGPRTDRWASLLRARGERLGW